MAARTLPLDGNGAAIPDRFPAFERAFIARAPAFACRRETLEDRTFLTAQFVACSPLGATLPIAMVEQQAEFQIAAHTAAFPHALRVIATEAGQPVGRMMIDWSDGATHLVDIAVLPAFQRRGIGLHGLRAWLALADAARLPASLCVRTDNPARMLYAALGFSAEASAEGGAFVTMSRPAMPYPTDG